VTALRIVAAGPAVSIQDGGRYGRMRFGVTAAGPMDPLAHATANLALGNAADAGAIEISLGGLEVEVDDAPLAVALAGGRFDVGVDGRAVPPAARLVLAPGERLRVRAGAAGAWCYLAIGAALDIVPALGSVATHARSRLGGLDGRALTAGDRVPVRPAAAPAPGVAALEAPWLERPGDVIRVVLGPQADYFAADQIAAFCAGPWSVSPRSDRMAYLLDGPTIGHAKGFNIISDGIVMGAVQVPGDGRPMVLMADRQVTGGYPKIATVIGADLGRLAQRRPGVPFSFQVVSLEDAVAARRAERDALAAPIRAVPLVRTDLTSELLLATNLIDGVVGAGSE
jgi:biotin-dependent carboxylase-like uncharacterized protein